MRAEFSYLRARSLAEALDLLDRRGNEIKVAAGMTDLMMEVKEGYLRAPYLLDINPIKELKFIHDSGDSIQIGPMVTHAELASSELIKQAAPVLAEAAGSVGSPQIRNIGTIGGNIGNASPAADTLPALAVLNSTVTLSGKGGSRTLPLVEFFLGPYTTVCRPREMLTKIKIPKLGRQWQGVFVKLARRKALAPSRISLAVLALTKDRKIKDVRISVGATTPTPNRMREAEAYLEDRVCSDDDLSHAAFLTAEEVIRRSGLRHSSHYKRPAIEGLVLKAFRVLFRRGQGK